MVGNPPVELAVPFYIFRFSGFERDTDHIFRAVFMYICSVQGKLSASPPASVQVGAVKIAFAHGEIIYCIQKIGLSFTVIACYGIHLWRKRDIGTWNIFKI